MKYRFLEDFLYNGMTYSAGQTYELSEEIVAALPPGIAEPETPPATTKSK